MTLSQSFIQAWQIWINAHHPFYHSRNRRFNAPTYSAELILDHNATHLYSLGLAAIEGKAWNYPQLAREALAEIDHAIEELNECAVGETEKAEIREYISLTRNLLSELIKLKSNHQS
ncbi:MAG: hypothetical protein AB1757_31135 [Acidobacteriota bacterium]